MLSITKSNGSKSQHHFNETLKTSYKAWFVYFIIFNIYCIFWRQYVMTEQYDFWDSLYWWFKEWGMWLVLTPVHLKGLSWLSTKISLPKTTCLMATMIVSIAVAIRILIAQPDDSQQVATNMVALLPKYSVTYTFITLFWYFNFYRKQLGSSEKTVPLNSKKEPTKKLSEQSLSVEHLGLTITVPYLDIYAIKSSGNYVDIYCRDAQYIKRSTLKELLLLLPKNKFMQVHRSYIVNLSQVEKLTNNETGTGLLTLTNMNTINVSKKLKTQVKVAINESQACSD